jgi:UDP-N-acetylglucosamine--N-acetylmuramyl-(pentapeptide) pyrophosphoryl-undecaprenol N-acetylglucosamine transferase
MASALRVVLAGGGSAGHLSPGIAVAERLAQLEPGVQIDFVCSARELDAHMLGQAGLAYRPLPTAPFPYGVSPRALRAAMRLGSACVRAWGLLRRLRPQAVLGIGGFVSVPVVAAARALRLPVALHVLDAHPDRANLCVSRWARWITVAFREAAGRFPAALTEVTGCPVRGAILQASRQQGRQLLGLDPQRLTVLAMGGSQGARTINEALVGALPELLRLPLQIVHLTGAREYERVVVQAAPVAELHGHYHPLAFSDDMGALLAAADLVVGRAGSSSLAEASVRGCAQILIPYPGAGGHQMANARALEQAGGAVVLPNSECTPQALGGMIAGLVQNPTRCDEMSRLARRWSFPHAAERVAEGLLRLARGDLP